MHLLLKTTGHVMRARHVTLTTKRQRKCLRAALTDGELVCLETTQANGKVGPSWLAGSGRH